MNIDNRNTDDYLKLIDSIGITIETARHRAVQAVNNELLNANWAVGKYIMSPLRKVESNHSIIKSSIKYVLKTYNTTDIQRYTVA